MADKGFLQALGAEFEDQDAQAFRLKMQNKALEGQLNNSLAERAQQHQYEQEQYAREQAVSPQALGLLKGVARSYGLGEDVVGDIDKLNNQKEFQTAKDLIDKLGANRNMAARMGAAGAPKPQLRDVDGKIQWVLFDPITQKTSTIPVGTNAKNDAEARKIYGSFDAASQLIKNMRQQVAPILTSTPFLNLVAQKPMLKLNDLAQVDPKAAATFDYIKAHAPTFAVTLRGTSRVSEREIEQLMHALPEEGDTIETAVNKLNNFDQLFDQLKYSKIKALEGAEPTAGSNPNDTANKQAPKLSADGLAKWMAAQQAANPKK